MLTGEQMLRLYPYDKEVTSDTGVIARAIEVASQMYRDSSYKQLVEKRVDTDIRLRPSLMGKAAIDILARKFFPSLYIDGNFDPRFYQLFKDGDTFECDYYVWLSITGVPVVTTQQTVDWYGIKGHSDFVVSIDGIKVLLELKTANNGYFDSVYKAQTDDGRAFKYEQRYARYDYLAHEMSDFRGHVTQASIYGDALGVDEIVIVLKDKNTSRLLLYNIPKSVRATLLERVVKIVEGWDKVNCWSDCFLYAGIPDPRKELRSRQHTGRYLLPPKLYGSPIIPLVYEWMAEDGKVILIGYRMTETAYNLLPDELREHYKEIDVYTYEDNEINELLSEWNTYRADAQTKSSDG